MIHLYCGDGKGKTTAAVGLTVRAAGCGRNVLFIQFMKGQKTGEINVLEKLENVRVLRAGSGGDADGHNKKFTFQMNAQAKAASAADNAALFENAERAASDDKTDMIVMDEAVTAVERGMLEETRVRTFVESFSEVSGGSKELVMTGAVPEAWMIYAADYVTDMEKIKHPFDRGVSAREGVEY